jgi:hypothetical protein
MFGAKKCFNRGLRIVVAFLGYWEEFGGPGVHQEHQFARVIDAKRQKASKF